MQFNHKVTLSAVLVCTLASTFADARLIIRGGASSNILGKDTPLYLSPLGTTSPIGEGTSPRLIEGNATDIDGLSVIPFRNTGIDEVPPDEICAPDTCEYEFNVGDMLELQGFNAPYGALDDVITTYVWSLFQEPIQLRLSTSMPSMGLPIAATSPGNLITSWSATGVNFISSRQVDVFLETVFPTSLLPGNYQVALTAVYTAPTGLEFGQFNPATYEWDSFGTNFSFESQRYDLTLAGAIPTSPRPINAPSHMAIFIVFFGLLIWKRKRPVNEK
jgi:hypothetical protein